MSERVVVTGGAGYIGSHACKQLAAAGYAPVAYDNLSRGHRWAVRWGPLEVGDIADAERLGAVLRHYRPVGVLHFAAHSLVAESVAEPALYYRNNVAASLAMLDTLREHGVNHVIFSSTCAVYGTPETVPIAEDHPQRPINPYGTSKLTVERMLADFGTAYGLRSISLRYFNAAGADPDGEIGEAHEPETHLIPLVLEAAARLRDTVSVFGEDYPTRDGTCVRDYIHVTDLADAHVLALEALRAEHAQGAFNLGTGSGATVAEIVERARAVTGRDVPLTRASRRQGDPPELVADAALARRELGWQPRYGDLDTIVASAWRWLQRTRDIA